MVTSDFRPEVEIRRFREWALKNTIYGRIAEIPHLKENWGQGQNTRT